MGAAWREVRDNRDFDRVLDMVKEVNKLDMEVCCTLGMLTPQQAEKLADAGLYAYNHNIDTSEEHYAEIITTRTYDDRLNTLNNVRKAGISVCSGGIIGLGETDEDRIGMLHTLANLPKHPESVPINALVPVEGTPLAGNKRVPFDELVRMVATARIMVELCERYGAQLIVDEAHATGVIGMSGEGLVCNMDLHSRVFARVHTFGKALGCHGAAVAHGVVMKEYVAIPESTYKKTGELKKFFARSYDY
eukprot:gene10198-10003_t